MRNSWSVAAAQRRSERTYGHARRAGASAALLAMPLVAWALGHVAWEAGQRLARDLGNAPALALAPVTPAELLACVAGVGGAAVAAHLSLASLLAVASPRGSRARVAALGLLPVGWRRLVSIAATGALSAGLAMPASAAPDASDAGWVPEPIAAEGSPARALVGPVPPTPETQPGAPDRDLQTRPPSRTLAAAPGQEAGSEAARRAAPEHSDGTGHSGATERPNSSASSPTTEYVVVAGDSLWSIAADALEGSLGDGQASRDAAHIAAAWPALFSANRDVVGPDPALIHPGQELALPDRWTP